MLQLAFIRQNVEFVKERLKIRNFDRLNLVDDLIELDKKARKLQSEKEEIQSKIKILSRSTGSLMQEGRKEEAEQKKSEVTHYKFQFEDVAELDEVKKSIDSILL